MKAAYPNKNIFSRNNSHSQYVKQKILCYLPLNKTTLAILFKSAACLAVAAIALLWAGWTFYSLYNFRSPLDSQPPVPGEPVGPQAVRRLVFVLIDGLRYDTASDPAVMPVLNRLRGEGASARMISRTPSFSQPGYSALMTGAWPDIAYGPGFNLSYENIPSWTQDNLFSAASRSGLKTAAAGLHWFDKLIPPDGQPNASFYVPDEGADYDRSVVDAALDWLVDPQAFQFVFIHLTQVDYAGHAEGGPVDPRWNAAAQRVDELLSEITAYLDLNFDAVVVTSDHGHIDHGGHGGQEPEVITEPFVLAGAGVLPGEYDEIRIVDFAPTVAALLGTNLPASAQGRVLTEMLDLPEETLTALPAAEAAQQEALVSTYARAIGFDEAKFSGKGMASMEPEVAQHPSLLWQPALERSQNARMREERLWRAFVFFPAVIGFAFLLTSSGKEKRWTAAGSLIYLILFNFVYAVILDRTYTFSSVSSPASLALLTGLISPAAMSGAWLFFAKKTQLFQHDRLTAINLSLNLTLAVVWMLMLAPLVSFVLNGPIIRWAHPEPVSFFLGLLSLLQIAPAALAGLLLSGAAVLADWIRPRILQQRKLLRFIGGD